MTATLALLTLTAARCYFLSSTRPLCVAPWQLHPTFIDGVSICLADLQHGVVARRQQCRCEYFRWRPSYCWPTERPVGAHASIQAGHGTLPVCRLSGHMDNSAVYMLLSLRTSDGTGALLVCIDLILRIDLAIDSHCYHILFSSHFYCMVFVCSI